EHLKEALKISPNKHQIYFALAENYMKQGDGERAFKILEKAVELTPQYETAKVNLAFLAAILSRHEVVQEMISVEIGAQNLAKIGNGYINSQQFDRAIELYSQASQKDLNNPEYHAVLAGLYLNQGFREEAIEEANKAKELDPENYGDKVDEFLQNVKAR
ncbi:MAG: hypothetical protein COU22_02330, partial [Candidatus Komeilibacteria bacterium CG10_big_fil_rev_8_21_14_0_10_41_13]